MREIARARMTTAAAPRIEARSLRTLADLPCPRGTLPLIGNLHQLNLGQLHAQLEGWAEELGPLYRFAIGPRRMMVVADRAMIDAILRARPDTFSREAGVEPVFRELRMPGVFSAEGARWRTQRRLMMETLTARNIRAFYPKLRTIVERLHARWQRAAAAGTIVDVNSDLKRFAVDVTTWLAFGEDVDTLGGNAHMLQQHLEQIFPALHRRLNAPVPYWRWFRLPRDRKLDRAIDEVLELLGRLCREARARLAADPARAPANFLEALLVARDDRGEPFSDDVILGNALQMLLAGEDTTATTITWAMHHLCGAPDAVAALRAEAATLEGLVPPDVAAAGTLSYTGAVLDEAMRLRPIAPIFFNSSVAATTIGDVAVPAGTSIIALTRVASLASTSFANPTAFDPGRWLAPPPVHDAAASIPFGSGPRICPGRSLALLEMRVVLAMVYRAFDVEPLPGEVTEQYAFTMDPVGFRVRFHERR